MAAINKDDDAGSAVGVGLEKVVFGLEKVRNRS